MSLLRAQTVALLACPVCRASVREAGGALTCENRHSFDVAREGYVNLLPPQHRAPGIEGDTAEMLGARRRFLDAGYYAPIADAVGDAVASAVADAPRERGVLGAAPAVLDVGCGEGSYLAAVRDAAPPATLLLGCDLAKGAVKLAARRLPDALCFVADVHRRLYVRDFSLTVLLDVFAPRNPAEFARVLAPGGSAVVVVPAPAHLASLRERFGLLGIQEDKERRVGDSLKAAGLALVSRSDVAFPLVLAPEAVRDLVMMGPNRWHQAGGEFPLPSDAVETRAAITLLRFVRAAGHGAVVA